MHVTVLRNNSLLHKLEVYSSMNSLKKLIYPYNRDMGQETEHYQLPRNIHYAFFWSLTATLLIFSEFCMIFNCV